MKKIFYISVLCLSTLALAQQKRKTNVSEIKEKPKTNVPLLSDADDLLDIKSNEPNQNDLLDITIAISQPKIPNAGQQVFNEIGLNGNFTFNKKIGFMVNSSEGDMVSYFYLNTKNGYSMLDNNALKEMANGEMEGEMTQIKNANNDFFQYIKSPEGNYVMKMGSGQSMVLHDIQTGMLSKQFFKTFKKTGNKVGKVGGNKYPRVEYSGIFEGEKMSIWLSNPQDILIDTKYTFSISGYWGLGYIASPSGKTYMITGIEGNGFSVFMNYIENTNKTFSGRGYKPIGDMMMQAMVENFNSETNIYNQMQNEINNETDPKLRALKIEALQQAKNRDKQTKIQAEKFSKSSDLVDMPYVNQVNDTKFTADYYDMMILHVNQSIRNHELALNEAQKNNDSQAIKRNNCLINCTKVELSRLEKVKQEHIKILNQYKDDADLRDEKINQLIEKHGIPKSCACE